MASAIHSQRLQIPEPTSVTAANALAAMRRPSEIWLLTGLLASYLIVYAMGTADLLRFMNIAGPTALTGILGWSCYRIIQTSPIAVWAPLFWFRLACAVYFGFGALAPHIANEQTQRHIYSLFYFDDALNFKVNLVCVTGIFLTLAFSHIFLSWNKFSAASTYPPSIRRRPNRTLSFALAFLIVGGGLRYGLIIPYMFGLTETTLPGMFKTLSNSYYVGIYLLIVYALNQNRKFLPLALLLVGIEIITSAASFSKTELLLVLIFSFLGFISRRASIIKIISGAAFVLFVYISFQSVVEYGRVHMMIQYGQLGGATIIERLNIVERYFDRGNDHQATSNRQSALLRLSYVNANALVISRYDADLPGSTLRDAAAVFIPRALWPEKPIITQLGQELYFSVRGRHGSALGVGHFAEAYWNFGWAGIPPFMAVLALVLSILTRFSITTMAREDWLLLPVVFLSVNMGLRVDGHFVPDILGPAWMALVLGLALVVARTLLGILLRRHTQTLTRPIADIRKP